ncbi:MAG TPA: hypothetical protein VF593_12375 [Chthoniobacteraceae bacterium]|jgi:hypothetical protein
MARFLPVNWLLLAAACSVFAPLRGFAAEPEKLIPARFTQVTDRRANRWDINPQGAVSDGTNDCFDNGGALQLDGNQVPFTRPMMTADGSEFVLTGRYRSLTVTRRIRLDPENGALRYIEIFEAAGTAPQKVQANIHTDLGNAAVQVLDLKEKPFMGQLGKEDGAFFSTGADSRPGVVFIVADPKSKVKPQVRINGNRSFDITFSVDLPAGGSVAYVHYMAQRANASAADARELLASYYKRGRLVDPTVPALYQKLIANFSSARPIDEDEEKTALVLAPLQALAEKAEITRGKLDAVLIEPGSKLTGNIIGNDFEVETVFGKTPLVFAQLAGIEGGAGVQRPIRFFLRDGEILTGTAPGAKLSMKTESGLDLAVELAEVHLVTLRAGEQDGVAVAAAGMLVATQGGDRLAISHESSAPLEVATPWGMLRVNLAEIRSLSSVREPFPAHRLALTDGSRFVAMMRGGEWNAPSLRFGMVKLVPQSLREMLRMQSRASSSGEEAAAEPRPARMPFCELLGESRLAGVIDLPSLHLVAESSVTPVASSQILQLEASDDGAGQLFTVRLAGGTELKGRLAETLLPLRSGQRVWRVPLAHVVAFRTPEAPEESEKKEPSPASAVPKDSSAGHFSPQPLRL